MLGFEIKRLSRFGGDADGNGVLDPAPGLELLPRRLKAIPVIVLPTSAGCTAGARWTLDGKELGHRPCPLRFDLKAGWHQLAVQVADRVERRAFEVRDRLVVALGDSVASGEGSPAANKPRWLESRCHRSAAHAGFEQATRLLAQANPTISMTFVSLACSGATIRDGLLRPSFGIQERRSPRLHSQVGRLKRISRRRAVDAVLVSVGANDVHFSGVVRHCVVATRCQARDLRGTGTRPTRPLHWRWGDCPGATTSGATTSKACEGAGRRAADRGLNPTRSSNGRCCGRILAGVSATELRWAQDAVLTPLNQEVAAAARRHGWRFVDDVASDFRRHGYCASGPDRWVRALPTALPIATGTLHPNERGYLAIADRVGPKLAEAVHLAPAPKAVDQPGDETLIYGVLAGLCLVLLGAMILALVPAWAGRTRDVLHVPFRRDPVPGTPAKATLDTLSPKSSQAAPALVELATKAGGIVLTGVLSVGVVAFVGAVIVWVRFWAARYPADQAVDAVSREELLAIGAQALVLFAVLGAAAVVMLWLLDGEGKAIRPIRRGLAVIVVAELAVALLIGDFRSRQFLQIIAGFAFGALLALYLLDAAISTGKRARGRRTQPTVTTALGRYVRPPFTPARVVWQFVPLALLLFAAFMATRLEHADERFVFVIVPIALALILFTAPGGAAGDLDQDKGPRLRAVRTALASVLLFCLFAFLYKDEDWLAGAAVAALGLAGLCLAVAGASKCRFLPVAVAVFLSVGVFGAIATCLPILDTPQAQPVAVLTKDGRSVCGVWVGDGDGRVAIAQVELSELGALRRPHPRRSRLISFAQDSLVDRVVGPLQPLGRAQDQAAVLRNELELAHPPRSRWRVDHQFRCDVPRRV